MLLVQTAMTDTTTFLLIAVLITGHYLLCGVLLSRWLSASGKRGLGVVSGDRQRATGLSCLVADELRILMLELDRLERAVSVGAALPNASLERLLFGTEKPDFVRNWSPTDLALLPESMWSDLSTLRLNLATGLSRLRQEYDRATEQDCGAITARTMILFRTIITAQKREIDLVLAEHHHSSDKEKPERQRQSGTSNFQIGAFANEA